MRKIYKAGEACQYLGISHSDLLLLVETGELTPLIGGKNFFTIRELDSWKNYNRRRMAINQTGIPIREEL